jgi:hypothetical protein
VPQVERSHPPTTVRRQPGELPQQRRLPHPRRPVHEQHGERRRWFLQRPLEQLQLGAPSHETARANHPQPRPHSARCSFLFDTGSGHVRPRPDGTHRTNPPPSDRERLPPSRGRAPGSAIGAPWWDRPTVAGPAPERSAVHARRQVSVASVRPVRPTPLLALQGP